MHPRYRLFPFHGDYSAQPNVFCPHVMVIGKPGYASRSLNLDGFGLRRQFDAAGRQVNLATAALDYGACDVLVGNSTSFGVSLTADDRTLSHLLQEPGVPCINLSIRGATMQQELTAFSMFRRFLPQPRRIFVLTGICDVSLATQPEDDWQGAAGGIHSLDTFVQQFERRIADHRALPERAKALFLQKAEEFFMRHPRLQNWFLRRYEDQLLPRKALSPADAASFAASMPAVLARIAGAVHNWGVVGRGEGAEVHVILQPVLGWAGKRLHADEAECMGADLARIPAISLYATSGVHAQVRACYAQASKAAGVHFWDANDWFSDEVLADRLLFADVCHLTDEGTRVLAGRLAAVLGHARVESAA